MSEYGDLLPDFLLVQSTPEYGRGVYTRKDLSAGVELIVSEPLVHVICSHWRGFHCDWCTETKSLKKCSRCKFVFYCSKECQKSDWEFHKIECKGISSISPQVPTDTVRLILRLLVNKTMANKMVLPRGMKWGLDLLTTNAPRYSEELKEILSHQIMGVKILTQDSSISFKMEDAFEIACKLVSNTFSLLNWEMNTIGSGVYLMPSLFNHSCNPNVIAIFDGFNLKLRTIRPVESGHQVGSSDVSTAIMTYLCSCLLVMLICWRLEKEDVDIYKSIICSLVRVVVAVKIMMRALTSKWWPLALVYLMRFSVKNYTEKDLRQLKMFKS
jgi:SET and MYND domain-containing protein